MAILNTAWGTPKAYSAAYRSGLADRAYRGPKQMTEDEACTDMYVGTWPYRVKQGLIQEISFILSVWFYGSLS